MNQFQLLRSSFNSSNGIIKIWTLSSLQLSNLYVANCFINDTYLLQANTFQIRDVQLFQSTLSQYARFIQTYTSAPAATRTTGLTFTLQNAQFAQIVCLDLNCLLKVSTPTNPYKLTMNVTIIKL